MIKEIRKILFTTNLTEGAKEAFQQTVYLADRFGASITLLHVIEEDVQESDQKMISKYLAKYLGKEMQEKLEAEKKESARKVMIGKQKEAPMIKQVLHKMSEDAKTVSAVSGDAISIDNILVSIGLIDEEICRAADTHDCDLIVMGYHARSTLADTFLSGTVRRVVRQSKRQIHLVPIPSGQS